MVCCRDCAGFVFDQIGIGYGLGDCKAYDHYVAKGASKSQLTSLLIELGNRPDYPFFWGGTGKRTCGKFKPIVGLVNDSRG